MAADGFRVKNKAKAKLAMFLLEGRNISVLYSYKHSLVSNGGD